jgi:hypothetical protein
MQQPETPVSPTDTSLPDDKHDHKHCQESEICSSQCFPKAAEMVRTNSIPTSFDNMNNSTYSQEDEALSESQNVLQEDSQEAVATDNTITEPNFIFQVERGNY